MIRTTVAGDLAKNRFEFAFPDSSALASHTSELYAFLQRPISTLRWKSGALPSCADRGSNHEQREHDEAGRECRFRDRSVAMLRTH